MHYDIEMLHSDIQNLGEVTTTNTYPARDGTKP